MLCLMVEGGRIWSLCFDEAPSTIIVPRHTLSMTMTHEIMTPMQQASRPLNLKGIGGLIIKHLCLSYWISTSYPFFIMAFIFVLIFYLD